MNSKYLKPFATITITKNSLRSLLGVPAPIGVNGLDQDPAGNGGVGSERQKPKPNSSPGLLSVSHKKWSVTAGGVPSAGKTHKTRSRLTFSVAPSGVTGLLSFSLNVYLPSSVCPAGEQDAE